MHCRSCSTAQGSLHGDGEKSSLANPFPQPNHTAPAAHLYLLSMLLNARKEVAAWCRCRTHWKHWFLQWEEADFELTQLERGNGPKRSVSAGVAEPCSSVFCAPLGDARGCALCISAPRSPMQNGAHGGKLQPRKSAGGGRGGSTSGSQPRPPLPAAPAP